MAQAARLADLAVVPHPDATDLSSSDALHAVLFDSGRPVLVAPKLEPTTDRQPGRDRLERLGRECDRGAQPACPG